MPPREVRGLTVDEFDALEDYLRQRDEALRREGARGG